MEELLKMSNKELDRAGVMSRLVERRLSQEAAAETLSCASSTASSCRLRRCASG
jgi:hypothetical protein